MTSSAKTVRVLPLAMTLGLAALLTQGCGGSGETPATASTTDVSSSSSSPVTSSSEATATATATEDTSAAPASTTPVATGPQIGDQCIGADIGRTGVDAHGNAIICDNYAWVLNVGQTPSHPWVDGQREWSDCLESYTEDDCREMLNPTG